MPMTTNEPRQPTSAMMATTMMGVSELPRRENEWVMPCAKPRRRVSTQCCMARVAVGSVAPTPKPISTRQRKSEVSPVARPVRMVAPAQTRPEMKSVLRGPNLSAVRPPMIWNSR